MSKGQSVRLVHAKMPIDSAENAAALDQLTVLGYRHGSTSAAVVDLRSGAVLTVVVTMVRDVETP